MKYLISVPSEKPLAGQLSVCEPVVPWYPAPAADMFVGTITFGKCYQATVREVLDLNLTDMAIRLHKQYPGLPTKLHENYVLHTAHLADALPVGTRVQVVITQTSAKIRVVETKRFYTLWDKQPTDKLELQTYGRD